MNVFQEQLKAKLVEKKEALLALKKLKSKTTVEPESESEIRSKPPTLDYSTSKVVRYLKDFEEERQKKKKKAFKETPPL